MGRKLIAVVAAGAAAGGISALMALASLSEPPSTAGDPQQPSTLLESASGNGAGTYATEPASPVGSGDSGSAQGGQPGWVAARSQPGGGAVAHGVTPATAPPVAGGQVGVGGTTWPPTAGPAPAGSSSAGGTVTVTVPGVGSSSSSAVVASSSSSASSSSTSTSGSTSTSTSTTSSGLVCTLASPLDPVITLC